MNKEQAIDLIGQVVEQYKGTAPEHRLLAQALAIIAQLVKKNKDVKKEKTDK